MYVYTHILYTIIQYSMLRAAKEGGRLQSRWRIAFTMLLLVVSVSVNDYCVGYCY